MSLPAIVGSTAIDVTRRVATGQVVVRELSQQNGSDQSEAERRAKRTQASLSRSRQHDPISGRTDIYL